MCYAGLNVTVAKKYKPEFDEKGITSLYWMALSVLNCSP